MSNFDDNANYNVHAYVSSFFDVEKTLIESYKVEVSIIKTRQVQSFFVELKEVLPLINNLIN